ncbi:MAG: recombinase family protein [Flavobacteriales bacterium]|nr:MAG: recombinase family protein [Flavobacteriales bacterium]
MREVSDSKISQEHLSKDAYLYVRQSTIRQVVENKESTKRQYALKQRAIAFGWDESKIHVIDSDLGESGASTCRDGFKALVTEVGLGRAGIVMGLEVSRLARNSTDWHRLLEICALTKTLILDEEGVYDPSHFNDRLLLGLKGTMSEAELHVIKARLLGGALNKAKRGELVIRLPIGFVHDAHKRIVLDPNKRVRESIELFFKTFRRVGTAHSTVKTFNQEGWMFPKRIYSGPQKGEVVFGKLTHSRAFQILRNPRYSGAYAYGLRRKEYNGKSKNLLVKYVDQDNWHSFIKDAHPGYITWKEYQENIQRLLENRQDTELTRKCPPREGPALLQGLAVCGNCGRKMTIRYHERRGSRLSPDYVCRGSMRKFEPRVCQSIPGHEIDKLIATTLLEKMTPAAIEVALAVQTELHSRIEEADKIHYRKVEQAQFERDLARRRYMNIDPDNRLVADELESEWNAKIREYNAAKEEYKARTKSDILAINEEQKAQVLELTKDFSKLWNSKNTSDKDRKRMVRLLIEDVTLRKSEKLSIKIRFKGGQTSSSELPLPKSAWVEKKHSPTIIKKIDELLEDHTDGEAAEKLNQLGLVSGTGKKFDANRVATIRRAYNIKSFYTRLKSKGLKTIAEICDNYNVSRYVVYKWRDRGQLKGIRYDDCGRYLYEPTQN